MKLPETYKALELKENSSLKHLAKNLHIVEKPMPQPGPGQILVKVSSSPCNPSDLQFLQGIYAFQKELPVVPGFEGTGVVVSSGGGFWPKRLMGQRVSFVALPEGDGCWAEYCLANALTSLKLKKNIADNQGAFMLVNPLAAMGLVKLAKKAAAKAIILTAAASQLARMVNRLANLEGIECINIVRSQDQTLKMQSAGIENVLDSTSDNFLPELHRLSLKLHASVLLDSVSGSLTGDILKQMPPGSEAIVYGSLSGKALENIDPVDLRGQNKTLRGFHVKVWLKTLSIIEKVRLLGRLQKLVSTGVLATEVGHEVEINEAVAAIQGYSGSMTAKKVLICF